MALFFLPFRPALDANALAVPGARLYFYASATSTPQSIYADAAFTTALTNPVVANAAGRFPAIYLDDSLSYRVILQDGNGVTLSEVDPYDGTIADSLTGTLQTIANSAITAKTDAIASAQAAATSATNAANAALITADLSQFLIVLGRYYATFADAIAATPVGTLFTSDASGTMAIYKRITASPGYQLVPGAATVTSVNASGGTTGFSFTGGPITSTGTLTLSGTLALANGGTGATTAAAARTNLAAAKSGANSDITALTGLTTALSVAQGGTGQTTVSGIRTSIGAAASGANTDITSLGGITTALSVAQGGTGQTTAAAALSALGGVASTSLIGNGQTWTAVARALSTSYQNTTGRSITVCAAYQGTFQVSANGTTWVTLGSFNELTTTTVVLPNNHYYRITGTQIQNVAELK